MPEGVTRSDSSIRRAIMLRVAAADLIVVPRCYDPAVGRYVTAYRPYPDATPTRPPAMMHCPKCKAHVPRVPPVCANCGADTRRRK